MSEQACPQTLERCERDCEPPFMCKLREAPIAETPLNFTFTAGNRPDKSGYYAAYSDRPQRRSKAPGLYYWDGKVWQSSIGWYDHGITHFMRLDLGTDG